MKRTQARGTRFLSGASAVLIAEAILLSGPAAAQDRFELDAGQWRQLTVHDPGSPDGQLQEIRKMVAQGETLAARKKAGQWIERYPNHPLLPDAHMLRADSNAARGYYYSALFDYEFVVRAFPASDQFHTALEREFEIAQLYTRGTKRHLLGLRVLPADDEGEELFILIQERAPGSELAEKASIALADYYFDNSEMGLATEAYDLFLVNYPGSPRCERAMIRLIEANLVRFKGPEFDPTGLIEASQRLKTYRDQFPAAAGRIDADALIDTIAESMARKDFVTAGWYVKRRERVSAVYLFRRLIERYPQTAAAADAVERLEAMGAAVGAGAPVADAPPNRAVREQP